MSDCGWGIFLNFLEYKCQQEGKVFLQIDRFFPSSKTCNHCLNVVDNLPLDIRSWDCQSCGTQNIDRDVNAARNCRDEGLRILFSSGTGETANGESIRPRRGPKSTVVATACEVGSRARIL
ncbi:MAG: zinc ribbon domain-containing protein [Prochloraceae cyanobacterium]